MNDRRTDRVPMVGFNSIPSNATERRVRDL